MERQLPWTMRELRPRITEMKGRSDIHYRSFELIFDTFRVEIILRGNELDEIRLGARNEAGGTRIDFVQNALAVQTGGEKQLPPLILNYGDLDEFFASKPSNPRQVLSGQVVSFEGSHNPARGPRRRRRVG